MLRRLLDAIFPFKTKALDGPPDETLARDEANLQLGPPRQDARPGALALTAPIGRPGNLLHPQEPRPDHKGLHRPRAGATTRQSDR